MLCKRENEPIFATFLARFRCNEVKDDLHLIPLGNCDFRDAVKLTIYLAE